MKTERQTDNPILRAYGNLCARLGRILFAEADKYADVHVLDEDFLAMFAENDATGVWDPNDAA
jgi:hypothetical protein